MKNLPAVRKRADDELSPAQLDGPIERAGRALGTALDAWDTLHPLVGDFLKEMGVELRRGLNPQGYAHPMHDSKTGAQYIVQYVSRKDGKETTKDAWLREVGADLVLFTEKLAKALASMTKSVDEAVRLREFMTGGADSRPDLSNASDGELIETLIEVAIARRLVGVIVKRAAERGITVEVDNG